MNVESIADSEGNSRDNRRRIGFRILAGAVSALMLCSVSSSWNDADARSHKKTSKHGDELDTSTSEKKHKPGDEDSISGAAPCISWVHPFQKPALALLCIHGLGLYSGSYTNFGLRMAKRGVATYAIDVRGFGSWMKAEGHEEVDFQACLNDVKTALETIHAAHPGLKVFLLGESMGGAIALRAASMYPQLIDGLISSVPAGDRFKQRRTDLKVAVRFLKGPNKQFDIGKDIVNQATKSDRLREDWSSNPLDRMTLSPKELIQFQKFMNDNHDAAKNICTESVLFVQGTMDKLVKPEGTWDLFNEVASPKKIFMAVPSEHLIFEEGQDKSLTFDSCAADLAANWMYAMANVKRPRMSEADAVETEAAVDQLVLGHYQEALPSLEAAVQKAPDDADAHLWLGLAYAKLRRPLLARAEFVTYRELMPKGVQADDANDLMLASATDADQVAQATADTQIEPLAKKLANGTPTVVAFYATWSKQSDKIDKNFARAKEVFGDKIKLVKIDVDDKNNMPLINALKVGPVPTFVFLKRDGSVSSVVIGQTSEVNLVLPINGIIE